MVCHCLWECSIDPIDTWLTHSIVLKVQHSDFSATKIQRIYPILFCTYRTIYFEVLLSKTWYSLFTRLPSGLNIFLNKKYKEIHILVMLICSKHPNFSKKWNFYEPVGQCYFFSSIENFTCLNDLIVLRCLKYVTIIVFFHVSMVLGLRKQSFINLYKKVQYEIQQNFLYDLQNFCIFW